MPADRIRHCNTILFVPARECIVESFRVLVCELKFPGRTTVRRLVYPRRVAVADAENVCRLGIERFDVAEVELLGTGNYHHRPGLAAVGCLDHGPACSARPDDPFTYDRKAAKASARVDGLF